MTLLAAGTALLLVAAALSWKNLDSILRIGYVAFGIGLLMSLIGRVQPQFDGSLGLTGGVLTLLAGIALLITQLIRRKT